MTEYILEYRRGPREKCGGVQMGHPKGQWSEQILLEGCSAQQGKSVSRDPHRNMQVWRSCLNHVLPISA